MSIDSRKPVAANNIKTISRNLYNRISICWPGVSTGLQGWIDLSHARYRFAFRRSVHNMFGVGVMDRSRCDLALSNDASGGAAAGTVASPVGTVLGTIAGSMAEAYAGKAVAGTRST